MKLDDTKFAANSQAWAIGNKRRGPGGFHVRRVVWGRLMAQSEKRDDETIRRAIIMVAKEDSKP